MNPHGPEQTALRVSVKEKRLTTAKLATFIEAGEPGVEFSGRLCNALGRAEYAQFSVQKGRTDTGQARKTTLTFEAAQPFVQFGLPLVLSATADHTTARPQGDAPFDVAATGVGVHVAHRNFRLEWTSRQRDLMPDRDPRDAFAFAAPHEVVELAVPTHKCAVACAFTASTLDSPTPSRGSLVSGRFEIAHPRLLGGDVGQASLTLRATTAAPLARGLFLVLAGEIALVRAAFGDANAVPLVDRLFLGGPMGLKGFQPRGVGPRSQDGRAALGGTARWQAKVGIESPAPLPFQARTHLFLAVGALDELAAPRASVGAGVVLPVPFGRLEVNAVAPVVARASDAQSARLQVGFGTDFV